METLVEQLPRTEELYGLHEAKEIIDRRAIEAEAEWLITNRDQLPEVYVSIQERHDNARTALMEALTASGHLSVVHLEGTLEDIHAQVLKRLLNGFDDSLPTHELSRRFAELCNELYIQKIHMAIVDGKLPYDTEVLEISDYSDELRGTKIGYRHENKKGMVRATGIAYAGNGMYCRTIEQVSRSNSNDGSSARFLQSHGISLGDGIEDVCVLETPTVYTRKHYTNGVMSVMKYLDAHAGTDTLYGDRDERKYRHVAYHQLRQESARREAEIEVWIEDLADLEQQLDNWVADGRIAFVDRQAIFKSEVERILNAICTLDPDYAADTFGKRSVGLFREAAMLAAVGDSAGALQLVAQNSGMKDEVSFCGITISVEKAQQLGLQVTSFGQLLEKGKESWQWRSGKCVVPNCPSPRPTKIGPCSVCRNCQHHADKGRNLMKLYKPQKTKKTQRTSWFN